MVQRADRDESVKRLGVGEVRERDCLEDVAVGSARIDRGDREALVCESSRELTVAATDLEDAGRARR